MIHLYIHAVCEEILAAELGWACANTAAWSARESYGHNATAATLHTHL